MTITERIPVVKAEAAPVSPWRRWLGPATFAVFGLVDIFVFGLLAHHGDVTFAFSQPFSKVTIPNQETEVERVLVGKSDLAYTLSLEVLPKIELGDFQTITLERRPWVAPEEVKVAGPDERALIYRGGETLQWQVVAS